MKKKILYLLLFVSSAMYGQRESVNLILGYQKQHFHTLEVGIAHGVRNQYLYHNTHLCGELLFRPQQSNVLGIKGGYSSSLLIIQLNAQAIYYTELNSDTRLQSTFALRPELGFTLLGLSEITYGYNLFLANNGLGINNHVLSIRVTLGTVD